MSLRQALRRAVLRASLAGVAAGCLVVTLLGFCQPYLFNP